mgnify:FL=1
MPDLSKSPNFEYIYKAQIAHHIGWVVCLCICRCLAIPDRRGQQPTSFFIIHFQGLQRFNINIMDNNNVWAIVICFLILWFCICSVIGVLAAKRGRSLWGWTLVTFLSSLILMLFFSFIAVDLYNTSLILIFSSLP